MKNLSPLVALALALAFGTSSNLSAQTILLSSDTSESTFDLQGNGSTDWVQFGVNGSSTGFNLTNEKSGGATGGIDTVGAVSISGDSYGAGVENTSTMSVSYGNGTSPTSSTSTVNGTGLDNSPFSANAGNISVFTGYGGAGTAAADGATLSFTINFNQAINSGTLYVVGNTFSVDDATFTASLSNGINGPQSISVGANAAFTNQNNIFAIDLSNITANSSLDLSFQLVTGDLAGGTPGFDNVSLNGVALNLTAAPEPSTYAMLFAGLGMLVLIRCIRGKLIA